MRYVAIVALLLNLGATSAFAQQRPVKLTFSGSSAPTALTVLPNTITDEELLTGNGTFGSFSFRKLRTDESAPESFGSCGSGVGPTLQVPVAGGVLRFEDGSLLTVNLMTEGALCVDLDHLVGHLSENYAITGGTGRFQGVSGVLTLTAELTPVLLSPSGSVLMLTVTGRLDGTLIAAP